MNEPRLETPLAILLSYR